LIVVITRQLQRRGVGREGQTYEMLAICRSLELARAVFAAAIAEKPAGLHDPEQDTRGAAFRRQRSRAGALPINTRSARVKPNNANTRKALRPASSVFQMEARCRLSLLPSPA
jgi:hypothetical protein